MVPSRHFVLFSGPTLSLRLVLERKELGIQQQVYAQNSQSSELETQIYQSWRNSLTTKFFRKYRHVNHRSDKVFPLPGKRPVYIPMLIFLKAGFS